ncbi:MAG: [LysW]-aminoadipate kinase [Chloroflexota bacterium]|nr:[LysW]-aminoadipate kinase [Chloroflexota bacterium]
MLVIKLGGSAGIDYEAFLDDLARVEEPVVFIHGGNAELDRVSRQLGIEPRHVTSSSGQSSRFTDRETLDAMLMVYCGKINKTLVEGLQRRGVNAVGLSALDGRIAVGRRKSAIRVIEDGKPKMLRGDYAGSIEEIDARLLTLLLGAGYLPVLTPPALSREGEAINVDGDKLATEIAVALGADRLLVFSNTPGLLADVRDERSLVASISLANLAEADAMAQGRMKKKVGAAADAIERGVGQVIFADARVERPIARALEGAGTTISA